jgi:hypothetical protein
MLNKTTNSLNVGWFRILYCGSLFVFMFSRLGWYHEMLQAQVYDTRGFAYYHFPVFGLEVWRWLEWILPASLLTATVGLFTRLYLTAAFLAFTALFYPLDSQFLPFDNNLVFFGLLLLSTGPGIHALSIDQYRGHHVEPITPDLIRQTFILILGLAYFGSMISKLHNSGWAWVEGTTLRTYLYERFIVTGRLQTLWLADSIYSVRAVCGFTIIFESMFWLTAFSARARRILVPAGVAGHLFAFVFLRINFLYFFLITYLAFFDHRVLSPRKQVSS